MIYTINGNVRNGLNLRPKAKYGTIDKKDKDTYLYDRWGGFFFIYFK